MKKEIEKKEKIKHLERKKEQKRHLLYSKEGRVKHINPSFFC